MCISLWLENTEFKKKKKKERKRKRLLSFSGGLWSVKTTFLQACGQMVIGCLLLPVSQALCSTSSPEPEFLSQPDLEKLGLIEAKGLFECKNQAELG